MYGECYKTIDRNVAVTKSIKEMIMSLKKVTSSKSGTVKGATCG